MPLSLAIRPVGLPIDLIEARNHVRQDAGVDDAKIVALIRAMATFAEAECRRSILARRWTLVLDGFKWRDGESQPYGRPYGIPSQALTLEFGPVLAVQSITYLDMARATQTMPTTDYTVEASSGSAMTAQVARITPQFGKVWPANTLPEIGAVRVTYDVGDAAVVTASGNVLTIKGGVWKTLAIGDEVQLSNSGGALPAPLDPDARYYVQSLPTSTSFTVAATPGGAVITLTDTGTGTHYIGEVDAGLREWMLLRLGTGYDFRADVSALNRGKLEALPYIDTLLDPYRLDLA